MLARLLAPSAYRAMPWKNGQGTTREILIERPTPATSSDERDALGFLWRLSLAEVAVASPFSLFPGCDRTILLLQGEGMVLDSGEHGRHVLDRRFVPHAFSGDWQTDCTLLGGPCRDLNLMVDRRRACASVQLLALRPQAQALVARGDVALLFALSGTAGVELGAPYSEYGVPPEHTLVLTGLAPGGDALRVRAEDTGAVALYITLTRVPG
ncbi:MAG: HutD family protein [Polyangia bacterium]